MSYSLIVRRPDRSPEGVPKTELEAHLRELMPLKRRDDDHGFSLASRRKEVVLWIDMWLWDDSIDDAIDGASEANEIILDVPFWALPSTAAALGRIAFQVADRLQWEVFDPQEERCIAPSDLEANIRRSLGWYEGTVLPWIRRWIQRGGDE